MKAPDAFNIIRPIKESAKPIQYYDTDILFCDRCRDICDHYSVTKDMYNTGDSRSEAYCSGSLPFCPMSDMVEEKIKQYHDDYSMTMEMCSEAKDDFWIAVTEALNNNQAATLLQLMQTNRQQYITDISIYEVQNEN